MNCLINLKFNGLHIKIKLKYEQASMEFISLYLIVLKCKE
jgi:hypothetical protein